MHCRFPCDTIGSCDLPSILLVLKLYDCIVLQVRVITPDREGYVKLNGGLLMVEVGSLSESVGKFKARLTGVLELPVNKQKITREGVGVMKDDNTLAHYNVGPDVQLLLDVRERAGRKK